MPSTDEYMSIGETTTRLRNSRSRNRSGVNIGGREGVPRPPANAASTRATKPGSRSCSSPCVMRRLRVSRLNANSSGGWVT